MFGGKILLAGYTTLVVLVLFSVNCYANNNCAPSWCGNNDNITDPKNCRDKRFEFECENNRTVLRLFSGKYYVEEIDYDNQTIRVVDVGIHKDDCSSLPLYSLTADNFTRTYNFYRYPFHMRYTYHGLLVVVFMNCENPVTSSPRYVDRNSSGSVEGQYLYVAAGELNVSDVADLCTVEMMVPIAQPPLLMSGENRGNISISLLDVHNAMANGFELYYYDFCPPNWSSSQCA